MAAQPDLPEGFPWPDRTREWWQVLGESKQAAAFASTDWQDLLNAALLHAAVWGDYDISQVPKLNAILAAYSLPRDAPTAEAKGTVLDELNARRARRVAGAAAGS